MFSRGGGGGGQLIWYRAMLSVQWELNFSGRCSEKVSMHVSDFNLDYHLGSSIVP